VRDIFDLVNVPNHDVMIAGFPCQPFSIAGLRQGLLDKRGLAFLEITRILKESKSPIFLLENVKGILSHNRGETFRYMIQELEKCGYSVKAETMNSMTHGNVPQNRERVFIVGFRDPKRFANFKFPSPIPLRRNLQTCIENNVNDDRYFYDRRYDCYHAIKKVVKSSNTAYQWRRKYVRENKSGVCPALTANMGSGGHNVPLVLVDGRIRKLTPRECANFQGFPKSFILPKLADSKLYHQIGNSVTVPLITRIATEIERVL